MIDQKIIDDYLNKRAKKGPRFILAFSTEPIIKTTTDLSFEFKKIKSAEKKVFRPSIIRRIFFLPILFIGLIVLTGLLSVLFSGKLLFIIPLTLALFASAILGFGIYHVFINKKLNYRIVIDKEGILVARRKFKWEEIRESFILVIPDGRSDVSYLVLLAVDDIFYEFSLFNFEVSNKKLASYIEFYKNQKN